MFSKISSLSTGFLEVEKRRETLVKFAGVGGGMPPVIASIPMAIASNMLEEGLSLFLLFAFVSVCHCVNTLFFGMLEYHVSDLSL